MWEIPFKKLANRVNWELRQRACDNAVSYSAFSGLSLKVLCLVVEAEGQAIGAAGTGLSELASHTPDEDNFVHVCRTYFML